MARPLNHLIYLTKGGSMKSQTLPTRVVSNVSKSLQILFAAVLLAFLAGVSNAQTFYADWTTSGNALTHNFTLPDGTVGTISRFNTSCIAAGSGLMFTRTLAYAPAANYPSTFFTPTPPNPVETPKMSIATGCLQDAPRPFRLSPAIRSPFLNPLPIPDSTLSTLTLGLSIFSIRRLTR